MNILAKVNGVAITSADIDAELAAMGDTTSYEEVLSGMRGRDKQDSTRAVAPAVPAPDAVHIDNTTLTPEETLAMISPLIDAALA